MRKTIVTGLLAASMLSPVHAAAQDSDVQALKAQLEAMQAEMQRLSAKVAELEAEQANDTATIADLTAAQAATATQVEAVAADVPGISWKGAPEFEGEGGWSFKPRGRIQADAGFVSAPDGIEDGFGSEIRRARLGVQGDIPGGFGYKFEVDVAGNEVEVSDAFLSYGHKGVTVQVGQQNNFQSMEELTSSLNTSFIERAAFTDAFGFERRLGASVQYGAGDILVQAGAFTDNMGDLPGKSYSLDGRAVYMPKFGNTQLHLGGSVHYANREDDSLTRYRQRPLVHFTSLRFVDTTSRVTDSEFGYGLEAAAIAGPFHVAGEAFWQEASYAVGDDGNYFGGSAEVGYFLTRGDKRGYKNGIFDRVKPANPVGDGGMGAWQVNVRYDYLDLNDGAIRGGKQNGYYASLIWTPTAYTRLMANYGRLDYSDAVIALPDGSTDYSVDVMGMRAQVDF